MLMHGGASCEDWKSALTPDDFARQEERARARWINQGEKSQFVSLYVVLNLVILK